MDDKVDSKLYIFFVCVSLIKDPEKQEMMSEMKKMGREWDTAR
jgi:hypothetical protein